MYTPPDPSPQRVLQCTFRDPSFATPQFPRLPGEARPWSAGLPGRCRVPSPPGSGAIIAPPSVPGACRSLLVRTRGSGTRPRSLTRAGNTCASPIYTPGAATRSPLLARRARRPGHPRASGLLGRRHNSGFPGDSTHHRSESPVRFMPPADPQPERPRPVATLGTLLELAPGAHHRRTSRANGRVETRLHPLLRFSHDSIVSPPQPA